jgi:hypothetical protein
MRLLCAVFLAAAVAVLGCHRHSFERKRIDLTGGQEKYPVLKSSYVVGGVYTTLADFFVSGKGVDHFVLAPPGGICPMIEDYRTQPRKYGPKEWPFIVGLLDKSSRLSIIRLEFQGAQGSDAAGTTAYARIQDGQFRDCIVDLHMISGMKYGTEVGILAIPDPTYVELVDPNGEARLPDEEFTDSIGVIVLKNPPVEKTGRLVDKGPFFVSLSDAYGKYIRVEMMTVPDDVYGVSRREGGDNGLLRYMFDTKYHPATYGKIAGCSVKSRSFVKQDAREIFVVGIDCPGGSVMNDNGRRMDAIRYVGSFILNPFCVYMTIELNAVSTDMSSTNLPGIGEEQLLDVRKCLTIETCPRKRTQMGQPSSHH